MLDYNTYLSGEVRHLTFQKSTNHGMWQDSIRQQQTDKIDKRLSNFIKGSWLLDLSNAVLLQFSLWKHNILSPHEDRLQADQRIAALGTKAPENR